jgi:hypothetical protein
MTEATTTVADPTVTNSLADQQQPVPQYTDGHSYAVPRPFLSLDQAASVLGMTLRSIERSVLGRWGSKLPDGWAARKMKTEQGDEWRILPPPGFRVKINQPATEFDTTPEPAQLDNQSPSTPGTTNDPRAYYNNKRQQVWRPERHTLDTPTIVIDRGEEIEHLLRELVNTKGALAEERRVHLEDLRMITQLQGSMRLLEVNHAEQTKMKTELEAAKQELNEWKTKYTELVSSPWWRKMFRKAK